MIDFTRNQGQGAGSQEPEDTPIGVQILMLMPMVWLFWQLIEWGLR